MGSAWRQRRSMVTAAVVLVLLLGACGKIDEVREVFDTTPQGDDGAELGATSTTVPLVDLTKRLPLPPMRIVDEILLYTLDPDLEPPNPLDGEPVDDTPEPTAPTTITTTEPALSPGPLTHVRLVMAHDANVLEIGAVRTTLEDFAAQGAAIGEFGSEDLGGILRALYPDDAAFRRTITGAHIGPVFVLAHRWPEASDLRANAVRSLHRLDGVHDVTSDDRAFIHRATPRIDVPSTTVAAYSGRVGTEGFALAEGNRLVLLTSGGEVMTSTAAPRDLDLDQTLMVIVDGDRERLEISEQEPSATPLRREGCRITDRRGFIEARVCRYDATSVGIEVRSGGDWVPLVGPPVIPSRWDPEPPPGASAESAEWTQAWISPDGTTMLAQWGGTCETEAVALIDMVNASIEFVESSRASPWGPGARAVGWTSDGGAIVYLGPRQCPELIERPGLYLLPPETDDGPDEPLIIAPTGSGGDAPARVGRWQTIDG